MLLLRHKDDSLIECGIDEAGRGCLAGPVVAAAVILPKDYHHPFLNDSKQLSRKRRDELRIIIEPLFPLVIRAEPYIGARVLFIIGKVDMGLEHNEHALVVSLSYLAFYAGIGRRPVRHLYPG